MIKWHENGDVEVNHTLLCAVALAYKVIPDFSHGSARKQDKLLMENNPRVEKLRRGWFLIKCGDLFRAINEEAA
jgi:hypothetical protein